MANETHEESATIEALRSELRRAEDERERAVLEAQRAKEAKDYVLKKSAQLTTETHDLRTALAKNSSSLEQTHADQIRKLTAKHEDELDILKDERTALRQEVEKLRIIADQKGSALEDAQHQLRKLSSFLNHDEGTIKKLKERLEVSGITNSAQELSQSLAGTKRAADVTRSVSSSLHIGIKS